MAGVLVLGSTGMAGRAVVARFQELGLGAVGANRTGSEGAIALDASDPPPLESLIAGADLVVNAIGVLRSDPEYPSDGYRLRAARVNGAFPLLLARAAERQAVRVVHLSTDAVFRPASEPADEHTEISPREPYAISKALGEAVSDQVLNIRCSVVGPAPGRAGLWEWFVGQPQGAEVPGFDTRWTGVTSRQLAVLCGDLFDRAAFEQVRAAGPVQHFAPNGSITKFELLMRLGRALRPDLRVIETPSEEGGRELVSATGALELIFSGVRGWEEAVPEATAASP